MAIFEYDLGQVMGTLGKHITERKRVQIVPIPKDDDDERPTKTPRRLRAWNRPDPSEEEDVPLRPINEEFCKHCRRLLEGNGQFRRCIAYRGYGITFRHRSLVELTRSVEQGCPMCAVLAKAIFNRIDRLDGNPQVSYTYELCDFMLRHVGSANDLLLPPTEKGDATKAYAVIFQLVIIPESGAEVTLEGEAILTLQDTASLPTPKADDSKRNQAQRATHWLRTCERDHDCSALQKDSMRLDELSAALGGSPAHPTRLIQIIKNEDSTETDVGFPPLLRLVDDFEGVSPRYITLSHRWGESSSDELMLTQQSLEDFKKLIAYDDLTSIYKHAVSVAFFHDIDYLWIDSLCIIQDSTADWEYEAARMSIIYANSAFNVAIAAAWGDVHPNLFCRLLEGYGEDLWNKPCLVDVPKGNFYIRADQYVCYDDNEWVTDVEESALNSRAWVYQERMLSPRIIHFTRKGVYWECRQLRASETFPDGLPALINGKNRIALKPTGKKPAEDELLAIWDRVVSYYSSTSLTYESDRLIALSALARTLATNFEDAGQYMAGMWSSALLQQLAWATTSDDCVRPAAPEDVIAPSWSWASVRGPVDAHFNKQKLVDRNFRIFRTRPFIQIHNVSIEFKGDVFGAAKGGCLTVSGPLLRVYLSPAEWIPVFNGPYEVSLLYYGLVAIINDPEQPEDLSKVSRLFSLKTTHSVTEGGVRMDVPMPLDDSELNWFTEGKTREKEPAPMIAPEQEEWLQRQILKDYTSEELENLERAGTSEHGSEAKRIQWLRSAGGGHSTRIAVRRAMQMDEDEIKELEAKMHYRIKNQPPEIYLLPLTATSRERNPTTEEDVLVNVFEGLLLEPTGRAVGEYRRIGMISLAEGSCERGLPGILCDLGNQEVNSVPAVRIQEQKLKLADFTPKDWPFADLDFVPEEYTCYEINIV